MRLGILIAGVAACLCAAAPAQALLTPIPPVSTCESDIEGNEYCTTDLVVAQCTSDYRYNSGDYTRKETCTAPLVTFEEDSDVDESYRGGTSSDITTSVDVAGVEAECRRYESFPQDEGAGTRSVECSSSGVEAGVTVVEDLP